MSHYKKPLQKVKCWWERRLPALKLSRRPAQGLDLRVHRQQGHGKLLIAKRYRAML